MQIAIDVFASAGFLGLIRFDAISLEIKGEHDLSVRLQPPISHSDNGVPPDGRLCGMSHSLIEWLSVVLNPFEFLE